MRSVCKLYGNLLLCYPIRKYKVNRLGLKRDGSAVKGLIILTDPGTSHPSVNPDPRDPALSSVFLRY